MLDEGVRIIMEQLDIFNLFMKLYKEERIQRDIAQKAYMVEMSDEFKKNYHRLVIELMKNQDKSSLDSE